MTDARLADTVVLAPADPDLDLAARRAAVVEWNNLPSNLQALVRFDDVEAKHRRRLERQRERRAARSGP